MKKHVNLWLGLAVAGMLGLGSGAVAETSRQELSLPIVELNNPCTRGPDSIDGTLDIHATLHDGEGVNFLNISAHGSGRDANGLKYQFGGKIKYLHHDPLPALHYHKIRLISQGGTGNAFLTCAIHVNEHGVITRLVIEDVECRGR